MKILAALVAVVTLIALAAGGYTWYTATLTVTLENAQVISAKDQPEEFARRRAELENNALQGVIFQESMPGNAEEYSFILYTVTIENKCLLPAEMLELQISPAQGDIMSYTQTGATGITVQPGQTQSVWGMLVSKAGGYAVRDLYITYYIWGNPFTVKCTYG